MKKLKLALLGCGKLNEIVANALEEGLLPEYELVAVLGRDEKRAKDFAAGTPADPRDCAPHGAIARLAKRAAQGLFVDRILDRLQRLLHPVQIVPA